jgi:serine/threonine protein kinase
VSHDRVVAQRYELIRPIGRGSAGIVYVARHKTSQRLIALKLIPAKTGIGEREMQSFLMEARAPVQIDHSGIVEVLDAGYDAHVGSLYLAMELLHGETLRDLFKREGATIEDRLDALEGLLQPLSVAHAKGFVHRDLKPENVFVARSRTGEPTTKLLDFGLAQQLGNGALTAPGMSVGTPRYMAPEQLTANAQIGPFTDSWAFGAMIYEALTGRRPFEDVRIEALTHRICNVPHAPAEQIDPNVDPAVARLADICLEKDPGRRPPDARTLMRLMKSLRGGAGALVRQKGNESPKGMTDTVLDAHGSAPDPPPPELDQSLRASPRDPEVHRQLLAFYRGQGIVDGIWLAATALDFLGAATRDEIKLHHHSPPPPYWGPDRGLDAGGWAALVHGDQDPRIDAVWTEIADALLVLHRRTDEDIGLPKAQKLDVARPNEELARIFAQAVGALRPGILPRLYRGRPGFPPRHLPASPPASVFPRGFEEPLPAGALSFAIGRHVAYYRSAHRVCTVLHEPEALESVFDAGLRVGLDWKPQAEPARMADLLAQQMSEQRKTNLRVVCARLGTNAKKVDLGTWRRAVELSCCRAGLLLSADLGGAAWMLRWMQERRRLPAEDAIDDLLSFWSSGPHVRLRHQLGLSVRT